MCGKTVFVCVFSVLGLFGGGDCWLGEMREVEIGEVFVGRGWKGERGR